MEYIWNTKERTYVLKLGLDLLQNFSGLVRVQFINNDVIE